MLNSLTHHHHHSIIHLPGIATIPTTDMVFKFEVIAALIAARKIGKIASYFVAPKANRISGSCCFSDTSDNNL